VTHSTTQNTVAEGVTGAPAPAGNSRVSGKPNLNKLTTYIRSYREEKTSEIAEADFGNTITHGL
jgi:hypothetical protein